jgi:hypothetical protein
MKKQPSEPVRHIPWGYGVTRVTAMAIDPERLYMYWEVTDPDLEQARKALPEGAEARLVLRIYDITGLIFDGTNAHGSFDVPIQRSDRQWFLNVNRPESSATIEIGLAGAGGAFAPLARSGRVDFPRREPPPPSEPEWRIAREVVVDGTPEPRRVRLEPVSPKNSPSPSKGMPEQRSPGRGVSPGNLSSEERLAGQPPAGQGSEGRLRDAQHGKTG